MVLGFVGKVDKAVENTAGAMGTASREMPRFNNNIENATSVVDHQAGVFNETAAAGVGVVNQQAGVFNETAAAGVGVVNHQAGVFNETAAAGVGVVNQQASVFNETAATGVGVVNQQASVFNETAAAGVGVVNQQAGVFNETAVTAAEDWERAVNSVEGTSKIISDAIEMWSPSMNLFLMALGPYKMMAGGNYLVKILQGLNILPDPQAKALDRLSKELSITNTRLREMTQMYQEVQGPRIVQNITKSSMIYNKTSGTIQSYFFYSDNNFVVEQLKGLGYFASSTMSELLERVFIWNAFCDAAQREAEKDPSRCSMLSNFEKRSTKIYFLDPFPKPKEFSRIDFLDIHKDITIINHHNAKENLAFKNITVRDGCSVRLENFTVRKIDATFGGKAALHGCNVNWKKMSPYQKPSASPFLFGGSPDKFNNPYNVCGTVFCNEETTYATNTRCCDKLVIPLDEKQSIEGVNKRTITNISDTAWFVELEVTSNKGSLFAETKRMKIKPFGGQVSFYIKEPNSSYFSRISGGLVFIDEGGRKYYHRFKGKSNLPNFTIVCPRIRGGGRVMGSMHKHDDYRQTIENEREDNAAAKDTAKTNSILVVGRFGSGKSTLLNTLAGVHWKLTDGNFSVGTEAVESFQTSKSVKGCTTKAVAKDITTFDGRQLTVIDTVGYDDTVSSESFYNSSNLTEVMDQYNNISAIVVVVNSKDPRLTQGFVESLACVPKSFKKNIQKNIVFVFTKWSVEDEEEYDDEPCRGFTEQVKVIGKALGIEVDGSDDHIPMFWLDNRKFKKYNDNARHTISNLSSFLDHVAGMPKLSCREFKEMRALSQFERVVRKAYKEYFTPSNRNSDKPSGFEKFLFECAYRCSDSISKTMNFTEKSWSEELFKIMQEEIADKLPEEMQKVCEEVKVGFDKSSFSHSIPGQSFGGYIANGLVFGGALASVGTAMLTLGLSLFALPACQLVAYVQRNRWTRQDAINRVVFGISEKSGENLYVTVVGAISSHIDSMAEDLQKCFHSINTPEKTLKESKKETKTAPDNLNVKNGVKTSAQKLKENQPMWESLSF